MTHKLTTLKDDFESKTKEMLDNLEDLNKKMDEIEDEDGSYDEESDQDLDSELGDTLDVNDLNGTVMEKDKFASEEDDDSSAPSKQGGSAASAAAIAAK